MRCVEQLPTQLPASTSVGHAPAGRLPAWPPCHTDRPQAINCPGCWALGQPHGSISQHSPLATPACVPLAPSQLAAGPAALPQHSLQYKDAIPLLKLVFQLIPAMLGQANYALGTCTVPANVTGNITAGNDLVGDRLIPPFGDGLCPCCAGSTSTTTCPASSVCRASSGGQTCAQLENNDVGFKDVLADW